MVPWSLHYVKKCRHTRWNKSAHRRAGRRYGQVGAWCSPEKEPSNACILHYSFGCNNMCWPATLGHVPILSIVMVPFLCFFYLFIFPLIFSLASEHLIRLGVTLYCPSIRMDWCWSKPFIHNVLPPLSQISCAFQVYVFRYYTSSKNIEIKPKILIVLYLGLLYISC